MTCEFCGQDFNEPDSYHGRQRVDGDRIIVVCRQVTEWGISTYYRIEPVRPEPERRVYFSPIRPYSAYSLP